MNRWVADVRRLVNVMQDSTHYVILENNEQNTK